MSKLNKFLSGVLGLYVVGLMCSMAVMSATTNILAVTATILWLLHWRKTGSPKGFWPSLGPDKWLWLYWGAILVGAIFIAHIPNFSERWDCISEGKWIWYLYGVAFAFATIQASVERNIKILIWATIPAALYAIVFSLTGTAIIKEPNPAYHLPGYAYWRTTGFFSNPLTFAYSMAQVFVGLLPFFLFGVFKTRMLKWALPLAISLAAIAIFFTFARGAWLSLAIVSIPIIIMWNLKQSVKILAAAVVAFGILFAVSPTLQNRISSFQDPAAHHIRYNIWQANLMMFKDYPLLGVGARRNSIHIAEYASRFGNDLMITNAHNNYLQVLAGTGVFGFIFWLTTMALFLYYTARGFYRAKSPFAKAIYLGSFGAQLVFHLGGFTQGTFVDTEVLLMFCFWLAILVAVPKIEAAHQSSPMPLS